MPVYGLEEVGGTHRAGVGRQAVSAVHRREVGKMTMMTVLASHLSPQSEMK